MKKVLIADDSASMRQMLQTILTGAGYEVVEACHGEEAMARARECQPQVVITDLNMPVLNGLDLIRSLRASPEFRAIPILMLTSEGQETSKTEGRKAGATGWILKPFRPDQLLGALQRILG